MIRGKVYVYKGSCTFLFTLLNKCQTITTSLTQISYTEVIYYNNTFVDRHYVKITRYVRNNQLFQLFFYRSLPSTYFIYWNNRRRNELKTILYCQPDFINYENNNKRRGNWFKHFIKMLVTNTSEGNAAVFLLNIVLSNAHLNCIKL